MSGAVVCRTAPSEGGWNWRQVGNLLTQRKRNLAPPPNQGRQFQVALYPKRSAKNTHAVYADGEVVCTVLPC